MGDELDEVRRSLPELALGAGEQLVSGERSWVWRVASGGGTVVVKRFRSAGEGWVRECAALACLPPDAPVPQLLASRAQPPVLVSSDVGDGGSVADALLGDDSSAAVEAVSGWAGAVGALHAASHGSRERFVAELRARSGDLPVSTECVSASIDESAAKLRQHCEQLGVAVPPRAFDDLRDLPRGLRSPQECALSPADTCPDNNIRTEDGLVLIDFEGAEWRHIAWDVAYLTVPWPSCWCAWRLPGDLIERAIERYRCAAESAIPYVRSDRFRGDVARAAAGWALASTAWFLPNALGDDPSSPDPNRQQPPRRAMILHRLDGVRRNDDIASLADLAARLREALVARWGEPHLRVAPAFDTDV